MPKARVLRAVGSEILIFDGEKSINAISPKRIKLQGLCAGDIVNFAFDDASNTNVIKEILPRVNHIDRPTISNVDNAFIVVSEVPKADFYIVDRILVYLGIEKIRPYIIISKLDIINEEFINIVKEQYNACVEDIIILSAKTQEGLEQFNNATQNKVSVLIGQSAVGKSSLLNALGIEKIKTDSVALKVGKKIERGKNTTKNSQLYLTQYGAMIADTPGFKALSLENLEPEELMHYYVDIRDYAVKCRYADCTHLPENEGCAVVEALKQGKINQNRYNRYIRLKNALIENRKKKYGK